MRKALYRATGEPPGTPPLCSTHMDDVFNMLMTVGKKMFWVLKYGPWWTFGVFWREEGLREKWGWGFWKFGRTSEAGMWA